MKTKRLDSYQITRATLEMVLTALGKHPAEHSLREQMAEQDRTAQVVEKPNALVRLAMDISSRPVTFDGKMQTKGAA